MNTTSPWLANLWHHFASAEAPHAVKLHASRQVAFETLSLRVVWFPRAKMKHSAFPHCQTRIVTKNIHLFGIFLILSPRKNGCFTWKAWNTFQMRRKSFSHGFWYEEVNNPFQNQRLYLRWKHVSFNPNGGIFHNTSQYKRKHRRNEVV